jgi:hypothetical protein
VLVARFNGKSRHATRLLRHVAEELRELMAANGIKRLEDVVGRRDLLRKREDLDGKAALLDVGHIVGAPPAQSEERDDEEQRRRFSPPRREAEETGAKRALAGEEVLVEAALTNSDRCVGVGAAGIVARCRGDAGLAKGKLVFRHRGAAGHYYGAYAVTGMELHLKGVAADSAFTPRTAASSWWSPKAPRTSSPSSATPSPTAPAPAARTSPAAAATASGSACARATRARDRGSSSRASRRTRSST